MLNKLIIQEYIDRLTKEDIYNFFLKENITLTNEDIDIIYHYLKNKNIFDNYENILNEIKDKLNLKTYQKILELYQKYKNKIS